MEKVTLTKVEDLSFDAALELLEERVKKLEEGQLPLEEALECFKEGISLVRLCNSRLKSAETLIRQLVEEEDGTVSEKPLNLQGGEAN